MNVTYENYKEIDLYDISLDISFIKNVLDIVQEKVVLEEFPQDTKDINTWLDGIYALIGLVGEHLSLIQKVVDYNFEKGCENAS